MKIYLDYIFLENLVINLVIIEQLTVFIKDKVKLLRKIKGNRKMELILEMVALHIVCQMRSREV